MRIYRLILSCVSLLLLVAAAPASADVSLRIMDNQGMEAAVYVSAGRCRIESGDMRGYAVIDTRDRTITHVDNSRNEYATLTDKQLRERLETVEQVRNSIRPHMETVRKGLQILTPEQRVMAERFIAQQGAPAAGAPARLVADGGVQRLAGLSCAHHRLMQGDRQVGDACLLQRPGGPVSPNDLATLDTVMSLLRELSGHSAGLLAMAGSKSALLAPDMDGVPVALRDFDTGESYRVVATSSSRIDESFFSGYRSYRQVDASAIPGLF